MKPTSRMLLTLLALAASPAMAQDKVVSLSPASTTVLDLYEQPAATDAARQISVAEAGLPLLIQARQAGFYQVLIGGKDYWVRGSRVRVSRDTTASCGTVAQGSGGLTAATPGAGKDACK